MLEDDTLCTPLPSDATLAAVLEEVRLSKLLDMEGGLNSAVPFLCWFLVEFSNRPALQPRLTVDRREKTFVFLVYCQPP